jgi:hypothetical protein
MKVDIPPDLKRAGRQLAVIIFLSYGNFNTFFNGP